MIVVLFSIVSALIVAAALAARRGRHGPAERSSAELDLFYTMGDESVGVQMRQLTKAARAVTDAKESLSEAIETASPLHDDRLLSDEYYNFLVSQNEDLIVERIVIENEAEALRPGSKEAVFSDAARLPSGESRGSVRRKYFDEGLFLRKREMLMDKLRARAASV